MQQKRPPQQQRCKKPRGVTVFRAGRSVSLSLSLSLQGCLVTMNLHTSLPSRRIWIPGLKFQQPTTVQSPQPCSPAGARPERRSGHMGSTRNDEWVRIG